jgi:hypothetical protein
MTNCMRSSLIGRAIAVAACGQLPPEWKCVTRFGKDQCLISHQSTEGNHLMYEIHVFSEYR